MKTAKPAENLGFLTPGTGIPNKSIAYVSLERPKHPQVWAGSGAPSPFFNFELRLDLSFLKQFETF